MKTQKELLAVSKELAKFNAEKATQVNVSFTEERGWGWKVPGLWGTVPWRRSEIFRCWCKLSGSIWVNLIIFLGRSNCYAGKGAKILCAAERAVDSTASVLHLPVQPDQHNPGQGPQALHQELQDYSYSQCRWKFTEPLRWNWSAVCAM